MSPDPMPSLPPFPVYRVNGSPRHRGLMYGRLARRRIQQAITGYAHVFRHYQGWDWDQVRRRADRYRRIVEEYAPSVAEELIGVAEGASVGYEDVLALNTRSEIMFAQKSGVEVPSECTSFGLTHEATIANRVLAGQNWDWIVQARQTSIVLDVRRDDGPDFVTVVEAGMLAKVGLNASGVGLCTNTLIGNRDEGGDGVPYHVLLRSVLDSQTGAEAVTHLMAAPRANSANYLVVDGSGYCVDLETTPQEGRVGVIEPREGVVTHANHFLSAITEHDVYLSRKRHTLSRQESIDKSLKKGGRFSLGDLKRALGSHFAEPDSVCQHPRLELPVPEQTCTVAGVILDPAEGVMHVAAGSPCTSTWTTIALDR